MNDFARAIAMAGSLVAFAGCDLDSPKRPPVTPDNGGNTCSEGRMVDGRCIPRDQSDYGADSKGQENAKRDACQSSQGTWNGYSCSCTAPGKTLGEEGVCVDKTASESEDPAKAACVAPDSGGTWDVTKDPKCVCPSPNQLLTSGKCGPSNSQTIPEMTDPNAAKEKACRESQGEWSAVTGSCNCGDGKRLKSDGTCEAIPVTNPAPDSGSSNNPPPQNDAAPKPLQFKALKDTFLISPEPGTRKNCLVAKDKVLVVAAAPTEATENASQKVFTVSDAGDSGCAAATWNFFPGHFQQQ